MPHDKIGPKEAELRALREAKVAKNQELLRKTFTKPGNTTTIKNKRGRKVTVQFKAPKRGRTGR